MGLDSYFFKTKAEFKDNIGMDMTNVLTEDLYYWRKNWDVHSYMETLYIGRGGKGDFNCEPIVLDELDLRGLSVQFPSETESVEKALEAMREGYTIIYDSWW
jgi:hypothetical protein